MPPVTPSRTVAGMRTACLEPQAGTWYIAPRRPEPRDARVRCTRYLLYASGRLPAAGVLVDDLALGGLLEGHRQVVLGAGLHHRRCEVLEGPLAEQVVVVVVLSRVF